MAISHWFTSIAGQDLDVVQFFSKADSCGMLRWKPWDNQRENQPEYAII